MLVASLTNKHHSEHRLRAELRKCMKAAAKELNSNRRLVENRARVQLLLLDLQSFLSRNRSTMGANPLQRSLFCLLIGAAFSLWRASFLTEVRRGWPGVLAGAEKFLTAVVRENAIGYNQEKAAQKWMVGFYLNSAAFRIDEILRNREFDKREETPLGRRRSPSSWRISGVILRGAGYSHVSAEYLEATSPAPRTDRINRPGPRFSNCKPT